MKNSQFLVKRIQPGYAAAAYTSGIKGVSKYCPDWWTEKYIHYLVGLSDVGPIGSRCLKGCRLLATLRECDNAEASSKIRALLYRC